MARKKRGEPRPNGTGILLTITQRELLQVVRTLLRLFVCVNANFCIVVVKVFHSDPSTRLGGGAKCIFLPDDLGRITPESLPTNTLAEYLGSNGVLLSGAFSVKRFPVQNENVRPKTTERESERLGKELRKALRQNDGS